jgi:Uncharacterized conserved protein
MNTRGLLEMTWQDTCFLHWPMAPDELATHLPNGLSPATYNGDAWVGVVAFEMAGISPRGLPVSLSFPELNLRTYVDGPSGPGVLFFNLDADDKLGVSVARRLFRLPYYQADGQIRRTDAGVTFASTRTHDGVPSAAFDATYRRVGDSERWSRGAWRLFSSRIIASMLLAAGFSRARSITTRGNCPTARSTYGKTRFSRPVIWRIPMDPQSSTSPTIFASLPADQNSRNILAVLRCQIQSVIVHTTAYTSCRLIS